MRKTILLLAILALAATARAQSSATKPAEGADRAYAITFYRPHTPAETYNLQVSLEAHTIGHFEVGQASSGNSNNAVMNLKATIRVLKVNGIGEPVMFLLTVDKALLKTGKDETPLGLDGAQIGVTYPGRTPHFVRRDGKKIGREAEMLLSRMFPKPKGVAPASYLGPGHAVRPGDSWAIKPEAVAKLFRQEGKGTIEPSKISGTVTFKGIEEWEGVPCLHLVSTLALKDITMPHFIGGMQIDMAQDMLLPTDPKIDKSRETDKIVSDVFGVMVSDDGKKMNIKGKSTVTVTKIVR